MTDDQVNALTVLLGRIADSLDKIETAMTKAAPAKPLAAPHPQITVVAPHRRETQKFGR